MAGSGTCIDVLDGVVLVTAVSRDDERTNPVLGKSTCGPFGADRCMEHHKCDKTRVACVPKLERGESGDGVGEVAKAKFHEREVGVPVFGGLVY
jgi:hypothetical protein